MFIAKTKIKQAKNILNFFGFVRTKIFAPAIAPNKTPITTGIQIPGSIYPF